MNKHSKSFGWVLSLMLLFLCSTLSLGTLTVLGGFNIGPFAGIFHKNDTTAKIDIGTLFNNGTWEWSSQSGSFTTSDVAINTNPGGATNILPSAPEKQSTVDRFGSFFTNDIASYKPVINDIDWERSFVNWTPLAEQNHYSSQLKILNSSPIFTGTLTVNVYFNKDGQTKELVDDLPSNTVVSINTEETTYANLISKIAEVTAKSDLNNDNILVGFNKNGSPDNFISLYDYSSLDKRTLGNIYGEKLWKAIPETSNYGYELTVKPNPAKASIYFGSEPVTIFLQLKREAFPSVLDVSQENLINNAYSDPSGNTPWSVMPSQAQMEQAIKYTYNDKYFDWDHFASSIVDSDWTWTSSTGQLVLNYKNNNEYFAKPTVATSGVKFKANVQTKQLLKLADVFKDNNGASLRCFNASTPATWNTGNDATAIQTSTPFIDIYSCLTSNYYMDKYSKFQQINTSDINVKSVTCNSPSAGDKFIWTVTLEGQNSIYTTDQITFYLTSSFVKK